MKLFQKNKLLKFYSNFHENFIKLKLTNVNNLIIISIKQNYNLTRFTIK